MSIPKLTVPDAKYRWIALIITIIGNFMSMLDTSIVNIALPKMMAVFSVESNDAQWVLTIYMLTMGVVQPISGYLCDRFGHAENVFVQSDGVYYWFCFVRYGLEQ